MCWPATCWLCGRNERLGLWVIGLNRACQDHRPDVSATVPESCNQLIPRRHAHRFASHLSRPNAGNTSGEAIDRVNIKVEYVQMGALIGSRLVPGDPFPSIGVLIPLVVKTCARAEAMRTRSKRPPLG